MLRENKTMIATVIIFMALLVYGGYSLLSSGTGTAPPVYEEPPGYGEECEPEPGTPGRQPITTGYMACNCLQNGEDIARTRRLTAANAISRASDSPVQIKSLHPDPYNNNVLLLETDGSLWSWGWNHWGQIGDGTFLQRNIPIRILNNVAEITPGGGSAILADSSLWAWGQMRSQEPPFTHSAPVTPRHILDDVAAFYPGTNRDFVIRLDGSLWAWPNSPIQAWGMANLVPSENEAPVHILDGVVTVSTNNSIALAHRCDGSLWDVTGDAAVHIMDAVASFYMTDTLNVRPSEILVIQTDNNLWAVDTSGQQHPRRLLDSVASVYKTGDRAFILQRGGSLWAIGAGFLGTSAMTFRSDPVWVMDNVRSVYPGWFGGAHVILHDGSLWGWGERTVGLGGVIARLYPEHVMDDVVSFHQVFSSNFAIRSDGSMWSWHPSHETIYSGVTINYGTPLKIMDGVAKAYTFSGNTIILCRDGALWALTGGWDFRQRHITADGEVEYIHAPRRILDSAVSVYGGSGIVYAIDESGEIWALGALHGTLGIYGNWSRSFVNISYGFSYATGGAVPGLGAIDVPPTYRHNRQPPFMAGSFWEHFFVDADARLWTWGGSSGRYIGWGMMPFFEVVGDEDHPGTPVHLMDAVIYVHTAGSIYAHAIQEGGDLWAWGDDMSGPPVHVMGQVAAFYSDWGSRFAINHDGDLYLWGWGGNFISQPGTGNIEYVIEDPIRIMESVRALYLDDGTAFAHRQDGSLWSWGRADRGILGHNQWTAGANMLPGTALPTEVISDVAAFHLQGRSAFVIQTNGQLWAWGDNSAGQLGDGTQVDQVTPVKIMDGVVAVHATGSRTFAVRADGSLWGWGWNAQGQLGNGTAVSQLSPVLIMAGVRDMYLTPGISFAIQNDNSLLAWGGRFGHLPVHVMDGVSKLYASNEEPYYIHDTNGGLWVLDYDLTRPEFFMDAVEEVFSARGGMFAVRENGELWTWMRDNNRYAVRVNFEN